MLSRIGSHASSLINERSDKKGRPQSERRNSYRNSAKRTNQKNGGTVRWNAIVTCAPCMIEWPRAGQRSRKCMAIHLTDHQFLLEHLVESIPITAQDKSRIHQFGKKALKGKLLGLCFTCGWRSADLMIADYEDLQGSGASEIYVKRFKSQEVVAAGENELSCASGTLRPPDRPRPSSRVEGNLLKGDDVEIEEGDKKGSTTEDSWSMGGEFIYRHHEDLV